ncbi:MAG: DUF86 domain-containing protein [Bacteroidales bacterium]|nr:DUF86 domain-containing protein [Bacteroidales bacterium]
MQREISKYLHDIKESSDSIISYLEGIKNYNEYKVNKLLRRGIERELEIIGEATNRILKIDPDIPIPHARRIVDLRNWVIHGYDVIDDAVIWGIIKKDVPRLKDHVDNLLRR